MIPSNIEKEHVIKALREIDSNGIPDIRNSRRFVLFFNGRQYPPKYVLSLANKFANGEELNPSSFGGGRETNNFLKILGFDIVRISSSRTITKSVQEKKFNTRKKIHDERCHKCKSAIEKMLAKIYNSVESNYKFNVSTNVEDYKDFPSYQKLKEVILELQRYRGHKDFIRTPTLPRCDFFVPNTGFILEFDESQHFTPPRKISLQSYPQNLNLGFSLTKWIALCEEIKKRDNDPPFRDEQRAWYDTLRDFLPEIKGLKPTVRLYSKEMQWCGLNPENPEDIAKFRKLIESRQKQSRSWVATVIIQSNGKYKNEGRLNDLAKIMEAITQKTKGKGVILFPGGWFNAGRQKAEVLYKWSNEKIKNILLKKQRGTIICIGVDGRKSEPAKGQICGRDQVGIAFSSNGIEAIGRKFHPAPQEEVELAKDHLSKEKGKPRVFELNGRKYFLCVCYDSFGIKQRGIPNFGIDVVLDLVHGFYPRGKGDSGDVYYVKHGFAGASKEWNCLVFGSAVFFNREIPERWPSGVYWNQGNKSTKKWRYRDNPIKPKTKFNFSIEEGSASIRVYNL